MSNDSASYGFNTPAPDDRRPWLWVASIVSLSYSLLTLVARLLAKWELLGVEDGLIIGAYAFGIIHWGLFNRAIFEGVGAAEYLAQDLDEASTLFFSSRVTLLVAVYLAKLSVLWFARRIFSGTKTSSKRIFEVCSGFTVVCGIASLIIASAGCDTRNALQDPHGSCDSIPTRWVVITTLDAVTELLLIVPPISIIFGSRVRPSSKATVLTAFALRIPNVGFMVAISVSYSNLFRSSPASASIEAASSVAVWMEVLLGYSLCSASIPCVRSFLTAFLPDGIYRVYHDTPTGSSRGSRNVGAGEGSAGGAGRYGGPGGRQAGITSTIDSQPSLAQQRDKKGSVVSDASQMIMIKRSVEIEVEQRPGQPSDRSSAPFSHDVGF